MVRSCLDHTAGAALTACRYDAGNSVAQEALEQRGQPDRVLFLDVVARLDGPHIDRRDTSPQLGHLILVDEAPAAADEGERAAVAFEGPPQGPEIGRDRDLAGTLA